MWYTVRECLPSMQQGPGFNPQHCNACIHTCIHTHMHACIRTYTHMDGIRGCSWRTGKRDYAGESMGVANSHLLGSQRTWKQAQGILLTLAHGLTQGLCVIKSLLSWAGQRPVLWNIQVFSTLMILNQEQLTSHPYRASSSSLPSTMLVFPPQLTFPPRSWPLSLVTSLQAFPGVPQAQCLGSSNLNQKQGQQMIAMQKEGAVRLAEGARPTWNPTRGPAYQALFSESSEPSFPMPTISRGYQNV